MGPTAATVSVRSSSNGLLLGMSRERRAVGVESWRSVSQEESGEAGLEQPGKVKAGKNLVRSHRVQGVVNMLQVWD